MGANEGQEGFSRTGCFLWDVSLKPGFVNGVWVKTGFMK